MLLSVLLVFLLVPFVLGADISGCDIINAPGYYVLTANIDNAVGKCINITVSDVIFNCSDYYIDGSQTAASAGYTFLG